MPGLVTPVVLVTGASSGIGRELALRFAAAGYRLVLVARREAELAALAQDIAQRGFEAPLPLSVDLSRADATARLGHELGHRMLEPAIVVNAAGFGLHGEAHKLDRNTQVEMLDLNVRALTDLTLRFAPSLFRHRGGVLNVASVGGFIPGPFMATYYASKAYVVSFGEALHHEWAPHGVTVTTLCPGPVKTGFQARAGLDAKRLSRFALLDAGTVAQAGYDGFRQRRALVVPSLMNKLLIQLPRVLPRGLMTRLVARGQARRGEAARGEGTKGLR
jgi:short-subunit dehydrogenase